MAYPLSYPFLRLPRTSFQSYKPTSVSASTCFASRSSHPRSPTALGRSLGVLYLVSATAPLSFWLRTRLLPVAWASSVTSSLGTTTQFSASRSVVSSAYPHPTSSLLYAPPLLLLLAISRFKLCGVRSRRRVLRGPLHLLAIWLDAAEMLRSTPLTLGKSRPMRKSSTRFVAHSGLASRFSQIPRCSFNSPTATTVSPRIWVSCTITASEAQYLLLMPWLPVCSAFLPPCLPKSLYAVLRRPSSRSARRG
jgi:hypothetical protein